MTGQPARVCRHPLRPIGDGWERCDVCNADIDNRANHDAEDAR